MVLVGRRKADYTGKDGQRKQGVALYFTDDSRSDVEGVVTGDEYFSNVHPCYGAVLNLPIGTKFNFRIDYGTKRTIGIDVIK